MVSPLLAVAVPVLAAPVIYKRYMGGSAKQDPDPKQSIGIFGDAKVLAKVDRIKAVATPIRPKLPSDRAAWAMAWLHAIIWHSFKSTYYNADKILPNDYASYREYCLLTIQFLVDHHDSEETVLFPQLDAKVPGSMNANEAQHAAFLPKLLEVQKYLLDATDGSKFDPQTFRKLMTPLVLPLFTHLADELETLRGDKLREVCTEDEIMTISKASHSDEPGQAYKSLPFMIQNLPPGSVFPPAPKLINNVLVPWVFWWKFRHLWAYTAFPFANKTGYNVPPQ